MDSKYYDNVYQKSLEYKKLPKDSIYLPVWKVLLSWLTKEENVHEMGCGSGQLAKYLIDNGINYIDGCDFSPKAVELANDMVGEEKFFVADVYDRFFPKETIIATEVLEHLLSDTLVVSRLQEGTRFIFSVPDFMVESHFRCFKTEQDIRKRYKVNFRRIKKIKITRNKHIFLIDSVI